MSELEFKGFAYIKFCEGSKRGSCVTISTDKFKHIFKNKSDFSEKKKYSVQFADDKSEKVIIKYVEESEEALDIIIKQSQSKRARELPMSQIVTASDTETEPADKGTTSPPAKKLKKSFGIASGSRQERDETYDKILQSAQSNLEKLQARSCLLNSSQKITTSKSDLAIPSSLNSDKDNSIEEQVAYDSNKHSKISTKQPCDLNDVIPSTSNNTKSSLKNINSTAPSCSSITRKPNKKDDHSKVKENAKKSSKFEIDSFTTKSSKKSWEASCADCLEKEEKILDLKKEVRLNVKKLQDLHSENKKLTKKMNSAKENIEELDRKLQETEKLNIGLQKLLIEKDSEKEMTIGQVQAIKEVSSCDTQSHLLPVGYLRTSTSKVHIGQNIWLDQSQYNGIIAKAATPPVFIAHSLIAVFGEATLTQSTITGKSSNRSKKTKNEEETCHASDDPVINQLEATKLVAVKEFFEHWLKHHYVTRKELSESDEEKNDDEKSKKRKRSSKIPAGDNPVQHHLGLFSYYVTTKIAYFKRKPQDSNKKQMTKEIAKCDETIRSIIVDVAEAVEEDEENNNPISHSPSDPLKLSDDDTDSMAEYETNTSSEEDNVKRAI